MCCVKISRGGHALHQQRSDVADHRRHPVALFQRVRRPHRNRFLSQAGVQPADNLVLPEQPRHGLFDLAVQAHVVVKIQILLARERRFLPGLRHGRRFSELAFGPLS